MAWKSALPGSPVVMCHQSIVTGSAAAADGSTDAAAEGGAADGAVLLLLVLLLQAAMTRASTARITMERQRIDTTRPPLTRDQTLGFDVAR